MTTEPEQSRADELKEFIQKTEEELYKAQIELKYLRQENVLEERRKWLGRCFKITNAIMRPSGDSETITYTYYRVTEFRDGYGYEALIIEYWPHDEQMKLFSSGVLVRWLMKYGIELSPAEYNAEVEALLKQVIPLTIEMPPRPEVESMCPCPGCNRCCCYWVYPIRDETGCVNFDAYGRCTCKRQVDDTQQRG